MSAEGRESFTIAQFSDMHCGDSRFDENLMRSVIDEINGIGPDLVVVPGDLTERGYLEQFEQARGWIDELECPRRIVIPGNHDGRNVGYLHFDAVFGERFFTQVHPFGVCCGERIQDNVRLVCADSSKPDLNDGELGRDRYGWLLGELQDMTDFKVFVMHHHLVSIPGTGRERNICWDAGDILEILHECRVDLVIAGHKHVPYAWEFAGMLVVTSGTACTHRTRGLTPPSFNLIRITPETVTVVMRNTAQPTSREQVFPRRPKEMPEYPPRRGTRGL